MSASATQGSHNKHKTHAVCRFWSHLRPGKWSCLFCFLQLWSPHGAKVVGNESTECRGIGLVRWLTDIINSVSHPSPYRAHVSHDVLTATGHCDSMDRWKQAQCRMPTACASSIFTTRRVSNAHVSHGECCIAYVATRHVCLPVQRIWPDSRKLFFNFETPS